MRRRLVVEAEAVPAVADLVHRGRHVEPAERRDRLGAAQPGLAIDRADRVAREGMLDVGQQQLLVLLLVVQAERDQRRQGGVRVIVERVDQVRHPGVDMGAIGRDLVDAGTRQHAPRRPRVPRPDGLVVGIEQIAEARIEYAIVARVRLQEEGLEEPGRVRAMPLGRARVGHRLEGLVLARQRRGERLGGAAHRRVSVDHRATVRGRSRRGYGRAHG